MSVILCYKGREKIQALSNFGGGQDFRLIKVGNMVRSIWCGSMYLYIFGTFVFFKFADEVELNLSTVFPG